VKLWIAVIIAAGGAAGGLGCYLAGYEAAAHAAPASPPALCRPALERAYPDLTPGQVSRICG